MPSYYHDVLGNLNVGDIAKSSDIHHIQRHIKDAFKASNSDFHDGEAYILGSGNEYKNSFKIVAAPKKSGRYVDSENSFDIKDETEYININRYDVRQPIPKTKTSLYSIKTAFRNTSNKDIPVICQIQNERGEPIRSNTITLEKNTTQGFYEIIFDLDFYPTPPNLDFEELIKRDGKDIPPRTTEESFDEGYELDHENEDYNSPYFSVGVSKLYFVIKRTNLNMTDLAEYDGDIVDFDAETSLGVYCQKETRFPADKEMYMELNNAKSFIKDSSQRSIYYQDIYANETTYLCSGGQAIIDGEKVQCLDTHISIEGGHSKGNVLTQIYLDNMGHLQASNKQASLTTDINKFVDDNDDPLPANYLPIALILTYSNTLYGTAKEPLIIQEDSDTQLPRSHHERLRRIEKQINWSKDIVLPARLKYTISDGDWVNKEGDSLANIPHTKTQTDEDNKKADKDNLDDENIFITTDEKGNLVVKLTNAETQTIPVTLREKLKNSNGKEIKLKDTDVLNVSSFSSLTHMVHDSSKGTLTLDIDKAKAQKNSGTIAKTDKEAKKTEYNPWDDSAANRPANGAITKNEREYKVISGKNGEYDRVSSYPGMTFYTNTNYKMTKLNIPIHKFQNCSGVRFYIWKRQDTNNKKNTVWLEKLIYTSKEFSLAKAKTKGKYQYMDDGFTINFGKGGLSLPKAQYVIIALPIPKSGTGSMFVETYKPKNSKDFCIKYVGAANASHFRLSEKYQEIWYNSASAIVSEEDYYTSGTAISKTLTWDKKGLERIKTVNPVIGEHLTLGNKTKDSYELYVSTGGKWIKVTPNKDNVINDGGATTFKWKLVFKSDGKSTPKLAYNSKDKYAIKFILTREKAGSSINKGIAEDKNKNMCLTSKEIDGDEVLRNYIGDENFALTKSRFQGYEFARVWAENTLNKKLSIDIQASDKNFDYKYKEDTIPIPLWSLHYCDLTLDDFEKIDVDYSDYDSEIEYDENNMRLKFDSEHSYNDDDIQISAFKDFTKIKNEIDNDLESETISFTNNENVEDNQLFLKKTFENPIDLTKYTGLKFKFDVSGIDTTSTILKGIGIYLSTTEETTVPSDVKNRPENVQTLLDDIDVLPPIIDPDTSSYSYYEGEVIALEHKVDSSKDGDRASKTGYYKYIKVYDEKLGKFVYELQQVHDLRTFNLYKIGDINVFENNECEIRIELDQDSNNLKYVKEIGIISLNDENAYSVEEKSIKTDIDVNSEENGKISIKLVNENETPLGNEKIYFGECGKTTEYEVTNANGIISKNNLNDDGSIKLEYKGNIIENEDNTKTVYSGLCSEISYSFSMQGVVNKQKLTDLPHDSTLTYNSEKTTTMTLTLDNDNKLEVLLKEGNNILKEKEIFFNDESVGKTNDEGKVSINLSGKKTDCEIKFNEIVEEETLYKACGWSFDYDVRKPNDRVSIKTKEIKTGNEVQLKLNSIRAISEEYLTIYNPKQKENLFIPKRKSVTEVYPYDNITLNSTTYGANVPTLNKKELSSPVTQICIHHKNKDGLDVSPILCYINNPFSGTLSKYKHLGVQLATDVYIPKDCLKINICSGLDGKDPIASLNLPTMNSIYYPNQSYNEINLSQIFKKIDIGDTEIKSISITITPYFYEFMKDILNDNKAAVNLFVGNIVLYRARTIPIYHNKMRFKFYSTTDGEIDHYSEQLTEDSISIRKIGAVLDYD